MLLIFEIVLERELRGPVKPEDVKLLDKGWVLMAGWVKMTELAVYSIEITTITSYFLLFFL